MFVARLRVYQALAAEDGVVAYWADGPRIGPNPNTVQPQLVCAKTIHFARGFKKRTLEDNTASGT